MQIIKHNADGTVTVKLDEIDLQAFGAAIWNAKEGVLDDSDPCGLHSRFFPEGDAPVEPDDFEARIWELYGQLRDHLDVDMG